MKKSLFAPILLSATLAAGHAGASSIVELEGMEQALGPSMVRLQAKDRAPDIEELAPGSEPVALSPSIVALGEPAVDASRTASVEDDGHEPEPLVIRGGIFGGASTRVLPAEPEEQPGEQAQAPAEPLPDAPGPDVPPRHIVPE